MHQGVRKLTVTIHPRQSPGYTHDSLKELLNGESAEIDFGRWEVNVTFKTKKDADFFFDLCTESGWVADR